MYLYLYDSFLNNKKYHGTLARIETRLTDLGIGGKICRLSPLRNIKELLADEIKNGVKAVVVVGNDKTLSQVINIVAKYPIILGLIPIGLDNNIARVLGIPEGEEACNILAARIIEKIDLGKINDTYFLSGVEIKSSNITIECENQYKITPTKEGSRVSVYNLRPLLAADIGQIAYFNPQDGLLEIFIQPANLGFAKLFRKKLNESIIPFKKLVVRSKESAPVVTDGQKVLKTPVKIEIASQKLRLIVGKKRLF